ncbi:glycosyltransferase [Mucilaginibacter sp. E4BP6]|uniref:glycosyltransferase n=1 Tax=Mucilaginibacter sp. E4BP6 TaxID=2723089 RepID=UPI0015CCADC5|nr:glycosyltransferase [Mucilaginibacter sp. E4BP6]NYE67044.1 UDP:flavonoid glycosyltransferase YjiC (YdhE family) [Mucilaginibacter sp. E4BP6]
MNTFLEGKKILFACVPVDGHFNPLTGLAKYLQKQGCEIRWYNSIAYADKLQKLDIFHYPFKRALEVNGKNITSLFPEIQSKDPVQRSIQYQTHFFAGRAGEYLEDIREILQSFDFDLLITDSMFSAIPLIKPVLNIPVLTIGVLPLLENSVDTGPYRSGLPPALNGTTRKYYATLYSQEMVTYKDPVDLYDNLLNFYDVPHTRTSIYNQMIKSADLYLQIGCPQFEYKRSDLGKNVRFIGALMPYANNEVKNTWTDPRLEHYTQVVLLTQGTIERDVNKLLVPTLEALAGTNILVIATTGGNQTTELRKRFDQPNVIIEDHINFDQVLPFASLYITNGGYGGALQSIRHNVPMVAAGLHEGKNEVCARIAYFECGIDLKTEYPTSQAIELAINTVLNNDKYRLGIAKVNASLNKFDSLGLCMKYVQQLILNRELNKSGQSDFTPQSITYK